MGCPVIISNLRCSETKGGGMGKAHVAGAKRPIGWLGWTIRILVVTVLTIALVLAGYVIYFTLAVYPKLVAEGRAIAQKAETFAKLTGTARRLAIYDAFVGQIDSQYYDQTFASLDWPKMKRDWRIKASVADDNALYSDVLLQMTQQFPTSHVSVIWPGVATAGDAAKASSSSSPVPASSPDQPKFSGDRDVGAQFVPFRRKGGTGMIVGEVWPGSAAEKAGVTPGWIVNTYRFHVDPGNAVDHAHIAGTFTRLTPDQMHAFETTGAVRLFSPDPSLSKTALDAKIKTFQISIDYDAKFTGSEPDFITRRLPGGLLYIRFDQFQEPSLKKVATALKTAGPKGVILDLRYNGGGYVLPLMNVLLPANTPVYISRKATGRYTFSTSAKTQPYLGPLAVLTGPASSSAAEITASVLKSRHRAIIIGRTTNGSVMGSHFFPLPDGGQVQLPVEDIETVDGNRLENIGVIPDIEIYPTLEAIRAGRDPALEAAETELLKVSDDAR